jgi:hypothetical protein
MSCHNDGSPCGSIGFGIGTSGIRNSSHCDARRPGSVNACTPIDVQIYPPLTIPSGIEKMPADAVMYDSTIQSPFPPSYGGGVDYASPTASADTAAASCGKLTQIVSCGLISFGNVPTGLSYQEMDSDTWFGYLYDVGPHGGVVGTPCYRLQKETRTGSSSSTTGAGPDGTGGTTTAGPSNQSSKTLCIPCSQFYCTPQSTSISYTYNGPNETDDPDCPYPTIFAVGSTANKIVFRYESLSTVIPDTVNDINFVYSPDGIDVDVWNNNNYSGGDPVVTTQNPWKPGDESFEDFVIVEGEDLEDGDALGLKVKFRIAPIVSGAGEVISFTGTQWEFIELINGGQNYSVNDTFTLSYTRNHTDGTSSELTIDLKVTSIGPTNSVSAIEDFSTLSEGDTVNGHTVIATRHSDIDNFPYHIVYIDTNGSDFVKDTQYTSSRNHVITVVAGYGIVDRAYFGGYYEFYEKSVQYTVHNLDEASPDVFNSIRQPDVTVNLSNGTVSGFTINNGGEGLNKLPNKPNLVITDPNVSTGKSAKIEGNFSGGVLTSIKIVNPGSGYSNANPPQVWVKNVYREDETVTFEGISQKDAVVDDFIEEVRKTGNFPEFTNVNSSDAGAIAGNAARQEQYTQKTQNIVKANRKVKQDFDTNRNIELPQRLYRRDEVEKLRGTYKNGELFKYDSPNINSISPEYRKQNKLSQDVNANTLNTAMDNLIQDQVPDSINYPENYVETTQRRFVNMPQATPLTKYTIKQYRADPRADAEINITLGCTLLENGCTHMVSLCASPVGFPTPPSSTTTSETDPVSGDTTETTEAFSYLLSPLLGTGCQNWTAVGTMKIRHNMTRSTLTYAEATAAYGNPFDI